MELGASRVRSLVERWLSRSRIRSSILLMLFTLNGIVSLAHAQSEAIDPTEFLGVYRKAVQAHLASYNNVRIEGVKSVYRKATAPTREGAGQADSKAPATDASGAKLVHRISFIYLLSDGNEKITRGIDDNPTLFTIVQTPRHSFALEQITPPDSPYTLRRLEGEGESMKELRFVHDEVSRAAVAPYGFPDYPKRVTSGSLTFSRVSRVTDGSKRTVKCEFKIDLPDKFQTSAEGWVELDETLGLAIRGSEFHMFRNIPNGQKLHAVFGGRVEYQPDGGKAVPSRLFQHTYTIPAWLGSNREIEITNFSFEKADPAEFTLAHYGLADYERTIGQVERRRSYWSAGVSVAAIVVAFVLFRIGRSIHKSRTHAKPTDSTDPASAVS